MVRQASVAGQFYENNADALKKQIEICFEGERGPGSLPLSRSEQKVSGIIVPHGGYQFSGPCAAWAYKELAESAQPVTYVLLGPNHFGLHSALSLEDWKTPLGIMKTNKDIVIELKDKTSLQINEEEHENEHSLEVQIPFLQFTSSQSTCVPIMLGKDINFETLAHELHQVFKDKHIVYIISSDFTHYGTRYGYLPFTSDIPKRINDLDRQAIEYIKNVDVQGFRNYINRTGVTICGFIPILVFLSLLKLSEKKYSTDLLMHYTSGDLEGNFKNSVSYASLVVR